MAKKSGKRARLNEEFDEHSSTLGSSLRDPQSLTSRANRDRAETTGRHILTAVDNRPATLKKMLGELKDHAGIKRVAVPQREDDPAEISKDCQAIVLKSFGIVIVDADPDQMRATRDLGGQPQRDHCFSEPEYYCFVAGSNEGERQPTGLKQRSYEYWQGYRAAVNQLVDQMTVDDPASELPHDFPTRPAEGRIPAEAISSFDTRTAAAATTWGLRHTRVARSALTGKQIRVAVLDTGIDFRHPDFQNRVSGSSSFVSGSPVQDRNGHGTHCAGTLCGRASSTVRYGVATDAELFVGKVLGDNGKGREADVVQGIHWAVENRCRVISASIQRYVNSGSYSQYYHAAGLRALENNALVVAAAGNHSDRVNGRYVAVAAPANVPSIVGVGAMTESGTLGNFSNREFYRWGEVDFVGPGVNVFSSDIGGFEYRNGTSMAAPHVAGIAALCLEQDPGLTGYELYERLVSLSLAAVGGSKVDFGHGLARAPIV